MVKKCVTGKATNPSESLTSSAGSAGSPSASSGPAGSRPSPTARSTRTAKKSSKPECETVLWILPPSVPTLQSWMDGLGGDGSISSAGDSPARIFPTKDCGRASRESDLDYGANSPDSFAKYDPDLPSWRTWQRSLVGEWGLFCGTWPTSALMQNGECFQLADLVPHIVGSECGLLPTPTARDYFSGRVIPRDRARSKCNAERNNLKDYCRLRHGLVYPPVLVVESMMGYPRGWTACAPLETRSFRPWQSGSDAK